MHPVSRGSLCQQLIVSRSRDRKDTVVVESLRTNLYLRILSEENYIRKSTQLEEIAI